MARPDPTPAADAVTVAVVVPDRSPYGMFDVVELTLTGARLRGPLLLELGERLQLRLARRGQTAELGARVTGVRRGDGHDEPITDVAFDDDSTTILGPIVA
jgi:hypothetical protein